MNCFKIIQNSKEIRKLLLVTLNIEKYIFPYLSRYTRSSHVPSQHKEFQCSHYTLQIYRQPRDNVASVYSSWRKSSWTRSSCFHQDIRRNNGLRNTCSLLIWIVMHMNKWHWKTNSYVYSFQIRTGVVRTYY